MKVIITGATGVVGGGALQVALKHPEVTSVVVLARREIGVNAPKLKTIIKKDYTRYEPDELEQLRGADGCIWCVLPIEQSSPQLISAPLQGARLTHRRHGSPSKLPSRRTRGFLNSSR